MPQIFPIRERITLPEEEVRDQIIRRVQTNDDPGISRDQLQYENPALGLPCVLPEKLNDYLHDLDHFALKYRQELSLPRSSVSNLSG